MPWFEYDGLTRGGTAIAGRLEAPGRDEALTILGQMGIEVREMGETRPPRVSHPGLSEGDFLFFNDQLASLARAGIALDEGLAQLAQDIQNPKFRAWIEGLVQDLRTGMPIDRALAQRESGLPVLYSRVVKAGIESGELPATLLNLNQHLRLAGDTRRILWEIVSYPVLVLLLGLSIASFFFSMVVPHFEEIFKDFNTRLPALTMFFLDVGRWFTRGTPPGWVVIWGTPIVVAIVWLSLRFWSGGRDLRERVLLGFPIVGRVYRASLVARFLRSVATAVATGIPLPQAVRMGGDATGSGLLARDADFMAGEVEAGHSAFTASQNRAIVPSLFGFCVQVTTSRDVLPVAIGQLAHAYENRASHAQSMLRVYLFPFMVLLVGGIMGLTIVSMFLPLVTLVNSVSGG